MKVLAVVAHPDDEVLGVGGTLLRHKVEGHDVRVLILYKCSARTLDEQIAQAAESVERFGIDIDFAPGATSVDDYVTEYEPDIVYTHSRADLHHEHQDALQRTLVACRPQSGVRALYCFETPSATDWSGVAFTPQMFVDITDQVDDKMHVMGAYERELRELPHPRNIDSLYHRGLYWGQIAGVDYAEAFETIREVW